MEIKKFFRMMVTKQMKKENSKRGRRLKDPLIKLGMMVSIKEKC
jgi:hypothetical protein